MAKKDNSKEIVEELTPQPEINQETPGEEVKRPTQVAIVGFAPSTMRDARFLFGNPDVEIWTLNQIYMAFPLIVPANRPPEQRNITRWFQIHDRTSYDQTVNRDHSHHEWMAQQTDFPIYMQKVHPDIPCSVALPKDLVLSNFRRYFTNSISWMLAMAILEGFKTIHLYGVDMAQDSEYIYERPSVEYFLGYVEGRGIRLVLPEKSDLLKAMWLYPYEDESVMRVKIETRRNELRARVQHLSSEEINAHDQRLMCSGALENMNYIEQNWVKSAKMQSGNE